MSTQIKMPTMNTVQLSGRLTADPELTFSASGHARLSFRLAHNRFYKDRAGEWQEESSFFPVTLWGAPAEYFAPRLHKGIPILVMGRLRSWSQQDEAGNYRGGIEVQAKSVQVLEAQTMMEQAPDEEEVAV